MNDFPAHKEKCGRKHKTANSMISLAYHTPDCIVTLSLDSRKAHGRTASALTGGQGATPLPPARATGTQQGRSNCNTE